MSKRLIEGDTAPDFTLHSQDEKEISLHDFAGKKSVVLYFYPKDFTRGCTAETREFGANYGRLRDLGAEVIGISSDTTDSHAGFASDCNVSFLLLSDNGGEVRDLYGVRASMGIIPGRVTFVIDKQGVVRRIFSSQLSPRKHASEAVDALKTLSS